MKRIALMLLLLLLATAASPQPPTPAPTAAPVPSATPAPEENLLLQTEFTQLLGLLEIVETAEGTALRYTDVDLG